MTDTTTTLPLSIPQTEHSVIKHWPSEAEAEIQLSCPRVTQTINWLGGLPKQRDFDCMGWAGGPMVVLPQNDMSGSMSPDDFLTINSLSEFGDRDFIFYQPNPSFVGPRQPYALFTDKVDGVDYQKALDTIMGAGFSHAGWSNRPDLQFFFDEAYHMADSYSMCHDLTWSAPAHKPGETPRGTKPSFIGGIKKSKQQRAAMKARRKQR